MGEKKPIPVHVALIMDGNGRWAEMRGVTKLEGHHAGMNSMKEIIKKADAMGVKYLSVYAFSTENWKRSREEVGGIFNLLVKYMAIELKEMNEKNMKVNIFGDWQHKLPEDAIEAVRDAVVTTRNNTGLVFNICLNYGSRDEIVRAFNNLLKEGRTEVTEDDISAALYSGDENGNVPDPDLIIRTSGEERLSNFLLWQAAYSEFAFTDTLWPDFSPEELDRLLAGVGRRERRFGGAE
ncbi:MAG: di-trans,poly-cis-decaprenylcistransferase [Firmicutes bacterium]|nr:di-trans,poly-cis-decaprenylcistransferase [Bacillota bacterium]